MNQTLHHWGESLLHLFFPHHCAACGSDLLEPDLPVCFKCTLELPYTDFEKLTDNPVEKTFWGRLPLEQACSHLYFSKDSLLQTLLHQLKYKGREDIGFHLGKSMGRALQASSRFQEIDALIPLPLHPKREQKRGYNQAAVICEGISEETGWPVFENAVARIQATSTQTNRNRIERWENMDGRFQIKEPALLQGKHLLLVDDVITTGATLEACGQVLINCPNVMLSIASLAFASR